jgi:hypothetical protein
MRKSEMKVLLDMLPAYTRHMEKHPQSLITRFFGLHKLRSAAGRSVSGATHLGFLSQPCTDLDPDHPCRLLHLA